VQSRNESRNARNMILNDILNQELTRANKKGAIKQLLFAANQVVFPLWILPEGYRVINIICSFSSTQNSGSKRPIFTFLGSLESPWPKDGSKR
jgi:hypothetical protein